MFILDWLLEIIRILTSSSSPNNRQPPGSAPALPGGININISLHNPEHPREIKKKEKDVIGTIKIFAGCHPPMGWLPCDGRIVKIRECPDLYTVIGTTYGGNGRTTFALPDLRGRVVVGTGEGENLTGRELGATFGSETVSIDLDHIPLKPTEGMVREKPPTPPEPGPNQFVVSSLKGRQFPTAKEKPLENLQPSMALNYIICCIGVHPEDLID
jgi:microcystin-dependent protein